MKYHNAASVLPNDLLRQVQTYVQAEYLYIPAREDRHKAWGELSGGRKALDQRNEAIRAERRQGRSMDELAQAYHLSPYAIRKILYQK